jgi:hypothetical protein
MGAVAEAIKIFCDRFNVESLAFGFGTDQAPALDRLLGFLRILRSCCAGKSVADKNCGDTPGCDCTGRIALQYLPKCLFTLHKPERVQHRHGAVELWLNLRSHESEGNFAELFA